MTLNNDKTHVQITDRGTTDAPGYPFGVTLTTADHSAEIELPGARPTAKWIAARITALSTWALVVLAAPALSWRELLLGLVPIVTEAIVSYLTPNAAEPGGVRPAPDLPPLD